MYVQRIFKRVLLVIFGLTTIGYTVYKLSPLISGPEIVINSTDTVYTGLISLKGTALRTKELRIFDKVVGMNENGEWGELIVKHTPYTTIVINAKDKWGKSKEVKIIVD